MVGFLCFIYGLGSMDGEDNIPSKEICDSNLAGKYSHYTKYACTKVSVDKSFCNVYNISNVI